MINKSSAGGAGHREHAGRDRGDHVGQEVGRGARRVGRRHLQPQGRGGHPDAGGSRRPLGRRGGLRPGREREPSGCLVSRRGALRPISGTKILDFGGFDSSIILDLSGGALKCLGNSPEVLSQRIVVGIILVGRLGVVLNRDGSRPERGRVGFEQRPH